MSTTATDTRSPEEIERSITARRESLKEKLHALEHRLSPGERIREVRARIDEARGRIDAEAFVPWAAVGAVATGAWLAARGLRRRYSANGDVGTVCVDIAVPPVVVP